MVVFSIYRLLKISQIKGSETPSGGVLLSPLALLRRLGVIIPIERQGAGKSGLGLPAP